MLNKWCAAGWCVKKLRKEAALWALPACLLVLSRERMDKLGHIRRASSCPQGLLHVVLLALQLSKLLLRQAPTNQLNYVPRKRAVTFLHVNMDCQYKIGWLNSINIWIEVQFSFFLQLQSDDSWWWWWPLEYKLPLQFLWVLSRQAGDTVANLFGVFLSDVVGHSTF